MPLQGTIEDWRRDMLEQLATFEGVCEKVEWMSANDDVVCPRCAARNGKVYTFEEARRELAGEFCCPGDKDDRCRCCFGPVID